MNGEKTVPYELPYGVGVVVWVIGIIVSVLAAYWHFVDAPPSWLTPDVVRTCALLAPICVLLAGPLPSVLRTPARREASHLRSAAGVLPPDIAKKHPVLVPPHIHVERTEHLEE